ncbi:MAG: Transcriptional regulator, ArsR family, partial [uncultured Thermomicrobiales bacterium]
CMFWRTRFVGRSSRRSSVSRSQRERSRPNSRSAVPPSAATCAFCERPGWSRSRRSVDVGSTASNRRRWWNLIAGWTSTAIYGIAGSTPSRPRSTGRAANEPRAAPCPPTKWDDQERNQR